MSRLLAASLTLMSISCDDQDTAPTGEAQGPCYPNGTCNEGLVCASELCVELDTATEPESDTAESRGSGTDASEGDPSSPEGCTAALLDCDGENAGDCLLSYIQCAQLQGEDACNAFELGCNLVGWSYVGCEEGSMVSVEVCGGGMGTTTGGGGTTTTTTTSGADAAGDAGGDDDCPIPGCSSYAAKLQSCWPDLDIDWFARCVEVYDICGSWECLPGTAGQVACVNSSNCETILDGACNDSMQC